ncbi:MORN repeat-containing protein [Flavobacteriaceae bacterium M23B6Z8]
MKVSKRFRTILYISLFLVFISCIYLLIVNRSLKQDLEQLRSIHENQIGNSAYVDSETKADSLLLEGNYKGALALYDQLSESNQKNILLKQTTIRRLLSLKAEVNTIKNQLSLQSNDSLTEQPRSEPSLLALDSLSFALEKSQLQLKSLKQQLQSKNFGQYITFKSSKGNRLHYVGQVKNNKANGYGIAIWDTGSRYEGQWKDNKRQGNGSFYWTDGEHYEGTYQNDLRSGQGTYYWPNGEKFVGQWQNDMREGQGTFYDADGDILTSGLWSNDELVKQNP